MFSAYVMRGGIGSLVPFPWRVGIVGFMAFPETLKDKGLEEAFRSLAGDPYFDLLEFTVLSERSWNTVKGIVEGRGVEVAAALQPDVLMGGYNPNALEEGERVKAVDHLKSKIDVAAQRGVKTVALCSGPYPGPERWAEAKAVFERSLRELAEHCSKYGITLILETFDREHDRRLLLGPFEETVQLVGRVRAEYENVGVLWDLSHAPMLGEKPGVLRKSAGLLTHVHIGCAKQTPEGLKDWHPGFYRPGAVNGVEEVERLLEVLLDIGYCGAVSFEVKPEEGQSPLEVVNSAKGVLYTAFARLAEKLC